MVKSGIFREDFYYRINVIPIHCPPIKERLSDIPDLAQFILHRHSQESKLELPAISAGAISKLMNHDFPGNVRELENVLERAMALVESNEITAKDIILPTVSNNNLTESDSSNLSIDEHVNQVELQRIKQALQDTNGNVTAAAKVLGTTYRSLRYRIKKLNIQFS